MKGLAKKIFPFIPRWFRRLLYSVYENHYTKIHKTYVPKSETGAKKRVLLYHISGLSFGGTEKFLQILAKHLDKSKYEVFFMYCPEKGVGRKEYLIDSNINFIPFSYSKVFSKYPFNIDDMKPTLFEAVEENRIDLLITAGSGYSEYPFNEIVGLPIIMINIFGSPSTKKNIVKQISISGEVQNKILSIVPKEKCEIMYIPSEKPPVDSLRKGRGLREQLNIKEADMVFGRIGRADDGIFDPIGLLAFKMVVSKHPNSHYLIMSPPPKAVSLVGALAIPNVHFINSTSDEKEIWAFHFALDAMAHFRNDGESCGLNIIESMIAGNPIITHRSHIWNAQLEYLDNSFARVADKDNFGEYASFMEEFISLKESGILKEMGLRAKEKGSMFIIKNNIDRFENYIYKSIVE